MRYFSLETLGDVNNRALSFIDTSPEGFGTHDHLPALGKPASPHYPADARISLEEEYPGMELASVIGNTQNYFIANQAVRAEVERLTDGAEIEYLPFTLINHKGRVHSTDYVIINPLGTFDCLDLNASTVTYTSDGDVLKVEKAVLSREKVEDAPALFRISEEAAMYVLREDLARACYERGFTNVFLTELSVTG